MIAAPGCPEPTASDPAPPAAGGNRAFLLTLVAVLVFTLTACVAAFGVAALMRPKPSKKG